MKTGLKKTLLVTGLLTLILVVIWAVLFLIQGLFHEGDFVTYLTNQFEPIKTYFASWNGEEWSALFQVDGYLGETIGLIVLVVIIILSIVLACVGRRGWVVLPLLGFIVLAIGIWDTRVTCGYLIDALLGRDLPSDVTIYAYNQLGFWYYLGMLAAYILGLICTVIFWIASLSATCRKREGSVKAFLNEETTEAEYEGEVVPEFAASIEEEPEIETEEAPKAEESASATASDDLVKLLREVVRDIVRDEVARTNANGEVGATELNPQTGVTFGGPLVVQYFNGIGPDGKPCKGPKEEDKCECQGETLSGEEKSSPVVVQIYNREAEEAPAPVEEEEVVPEAEPVAEVVEEPVPKPAPAPAKKATKPAAKAVPVEKTKIVRIPFQTRIVEADDEMKSNYNALKNNILSYGVKSRVSNSGDTFRLHRKTYVKITIAGKSLKLYFALNPEDYRESTVPVQDAGAKGIYADIPLVFKVKSALSLRRAFTLISEVMEKDDLEQGEVGDVDWVKDIAINGASNED
ncbi:MAG: hypothetical protein LUD22_00580 [Coprobacillus sp.]|nr:hypothetical protein [Coprobacillus sp.]